MNLAKLVFWLAILGVSVLIAGGLVGKASRQVGKAL